MKLNRIVKLFFTSAIVLLTTFESMSEPVNGKGSPWLPRTMTVEQHAVFCSSALTRCRTEKYYELDGISMVDFYYLDVFISFPIPGRCDTTSC